MPQGLLGNIRPNVMSLVDHVTREDRPATLTSLLLKFVALIQPNKRQKQRWQARQVRKKQEEK